jgi:ABC-2 type transport system permease protein
MAMAMRAATTGTSELRPSFLGVLQGEIFKALRQRLTWIGAVLAFGPVMVYLLFLVATPSVKTNLIGPYAGYYLTTVIQRELILIRVFIGFFLIALAVSIIGIDYQQGTIRIILSRGVGRVELLLAKMTTILGIGLTALVSYLVLAYILTYGALSAAAGTSSVFSALPGYFWSDTWIYLGTILISVVATMLMATAATVIGRSVSFGMGVALLYFPADNIGTTFLALIAGFTHQQFWLDLSAYLLGPALNNLPAAVVPTHTMTFQGEKGVRTAQVMAETLGASPFVNYDATHYLILILLYCLAFAGLAIGLTWRRDVLE